ncbi:RDD family protein [Microbulbifer sp. SSSA002]
MYPKLSRRFRALMIDSLVLIAVTVLSIAIGTSIDFTNEVYQSVLILLLIVLFEPVLVSLTGGSVGHHLVGVRIRKIASDKRINIVQAIIRTLFKLLLGVPSLIFVLTSKKYQALHDFISMSLVVVKAPALLPSYEVLEERTESYEYEYPGKTRRLIVAVMYVISSSLAISAIAVISVSDLCASKQVCNSAEDTVHLFLGVLFWVLVFVLPWAGWAGRLYGARRIRLIG